MSRGRLRVFLGAAPGVGKTCAMLDEGHNLVREGHDVVIALLETHGRSQTAQRAEGLETVPRRVSTHQGMEFTDLDVDAVIARSPEIALVDELAHSNAPGSRHPKRWEDVRDILDRGIDVITTVNVQHIESLNDVVREITGIPQRETVPDYVLRSADSIEVIDLTPDMLRKRLADGHVYPAERIDAALSNYFRVGNLTALRELALLWLADDVDLALRKYREDNNIDQRWETRERVVVSLSGNDDGDALLRRGARIAARSSGGELIAVHVVAQDGLRSNDSEALIRQQALVEKLGGTFHRVVGNDAPQALIKFAQSVNASQLVIGTTRGRLNTFGSAASVLRQAGDIDVHIVNRPGTSNFLFPTEHRAALSVRRRVAGFATAIVVLPLLTYAMLPFQDAESFSMRIMAFLTYTVVVAVIGGIWPALLAAVSSGLVIDFFFTNPTGTLTITHPRHFASILMEVIIALLVSYVVDRAARRARDADRSAAEASLLVDFASNVISSPDPIHEIVDRTRETFGLDGARLVVDGRTRALTGSMTSHPEEIRVDDNSYLELYGPPIDSDNRRLLAVVSAHLLTALNQDRLQTTVAQTAPLAATDKVRSALLNAVSHDLRRPVAAATASVDALRMSSLELSDDERAELLETASESLDTLSGLITELLDASRLEAGVLAVAPSELDPAACVVAALDELHLGPDTVNPHLPKEPVTAWADPGLLIRVLVNLLDNAVSHNRPGSQVEVTASTFGNTTEVRIIDHGSGIAPSMRDEVFKPFQRLDDTDNTTGVGLGLALSRGFVEGMNGTLTIEDTPGGGTTMVVALPAAQRQGIAIQTAFTMSKEIES